MNKHFLFITVILTIGGTMKTESLNNNNQCKNGVCSLDSRPLTPQGQESTTEQSRVIELSSETFNDTIKTATKPVIIDFYATWCPPCKQVKPVFHELAGEQEAWLFYSIDVDKNPSIASACSVSAMPTFVIFKGGVQWGMVKGALAKEQLKLELQNIIEAPAPQAIATPQSTDTTQKLMEAINQRNLDAIKKLVEQGADVNGTIEAPSFTCSVIQTAILTGDEAIIDYLLEAGAHLDAQVQENLEKQLVFFAGVIESCQHYLDYALSKKEASDSAPTKAIRNEELGQQFMMAIMNPELLKELLAKNVDVNCAFTFGKFEVTPLYLALCFKNKVAIDALMQAGAQLNTLIINEHGESKTVIEAIKEELATMQTGMEKSKERISYALKKVNLKDKPI